MAKGKTNSFLHVSRAEIDLPIGVDEHSQEVYDKARENFYNLIKSGALVQDDKPYLYIYAQVMNGRKQVGLVASSSTEDYFNDIIKKHEFTRPVKEQDRINHIKTTRAQTGIVFLAYREQAEGLLEGGCDLFLVETIFDTLNAKAALYAIEEVFEARGGRLPVMISGTITDASGRTLSGQTTEAFYHSLAHVEPVCFGLNCALGPDLLRPYVETLSGVSEAYVSVHPNAGLPNEFGEYDLGATEMASEISDWAKQGFLNIVGGCCGTTPEHIKAIAQAVKDAPPRQPKVPSHSFHLAGLEAFSLEW